MGKTTKRAAPPSPLILAKPAKPRQEIVIVQSQVQIPLSLPRVDIPLVPHLDEEFDHDVVSPPSAALIIALADYDDSHSNSSDRDCYLG